MRASTTRSLADALGMDEYVPPRDADEGVVHDDITLPPRPPVEDYDVNQFGVVEDDGELELGGELAGSSVFTEPAVEGFDEIPDQRHAVDVGAMEVLTELQTTYHETVARVQQLEGQNQELVQQLKVANSKLAECSEERDRLAEQNVELTQQLDKLRQQSLEHEQDREDRTSTLQNIIRQLREQEQESGEALGNARQEIGVLDNRLRCQANELESLRQNEQELQQQVQELTAQLRSAHTANRDELSSLDEKYARANAEAAMLRRKKAELELQVDELLNENNRLNFQLQNSKLLQHQMQRNQEMQFSMPEFASHFTPPPPKPPAPRQASPALASSYQPMPTRMHGGLADATHDTRRTTDSSVMDTSLSRSADRLPSWQASRPDYGARPSTAEPMPALLHQQPSERQTAYRQDTFPPANSSVRPARTLADVAGSSALASLSFSDHREPPASSSVRNSLSLGRRQQERSPFATADTVQELAGFEELEHQLTSLQLEKESLDSEYAKLYARATKTLQDKVRIKRIEARLEEIGRNTSELRRQLANKPA